MNQSEFAQKWIQNMMDGMDAYLNEKMKITLMESCGRACARGGPIRSAKACHGDVDKLLSTLQKWIGKENVQKDGNIVHLKYLKCLSHLVATRPATLSNAYCYCSQGWLKEMFETVLNHPVQVQLSCSIKRGGECCRFEIHI